MILLFHIIVQYLYKKILKMFFSEKIAFKIEKKYLKVSDIRTLEIERNTIKNKQQLVLLPVASR